MRDPVAPDLGALPWKPRRGVRMIRELDRSDVPTAGILRHRWRGYYLFRCLDGASSVRSAWAYATLSRAEARGLKRLAGEELKQRIDEILQAGILSLAVADERAGVTHRTRGRLEDAGQLVGGTVDL